jgi:hypothetical protein
MSDSKIMQTFQIGSRVRLRLAPVGEPGTVILQWRGKLLVEWRDLDAVFSYRPDSLLLVETETT